MSNEDSIISEPIEIALIILEVFFINGLKDIDIKRKQIPARHLPHRSDSIFFKVLICDLPPKTQLNLSVINHIKITAVNHGAFFFLVDCVVQFENVGAKKSVVALYNQGQLAQFAMFMDSVVDSRNWFFVAFMDNYLNFLGRNVID